jgi:D-alanine--poly(phosphoribitol) ligase subunit 1
MRYDFIEKQFVEVNSCAQKIAVVGSDLEIDWITLEAKVEQLSAIFKELAIPAGHPVIIYGHKEALFPITILACMYSTTTYIPIDKIYPIERIRKMIEITGAQIMINCSDAVLDIDIPVVINSKLEITMYNSPNYTDKIYGTEAHPIQYIMFTSGSTGEPKGVQITYNSILTFTKWAKKDFGFSENDVFMNQAPFTFDVSLCDILNAFGHGGTLLLTSTEMAQNQDSFIERLHHYQCSVWTSTPSFVYMFLRNPLFKTENIPSLKTFLFMGEDLPNRTCRHLKIFFNKTRILNAYGPTEATIVTTLIEIDEKIIEKYPLLPIGYPKPESTILIDKVNLDDKEGELIIVGEHVSTGYFKDSALTANKFFIHNGKRAFKTGDLAYYEDNMLFCMGRNDEQIKMHGFRIELNEISSVICTNSLISDAITVALKRNNKVKKIVTFVITTKELTKDELLTQLIPFLETKLPYYMIPGDIDMVNEFPYSISHKIDKNRLINDYLNRRL